MKQPEDVHLSREEGEALLARLEATTLTAKDRRVVGKVVTFYFWLLFALHARAACPRFLPGAGIQRRGLGMACSPYFANHTRIGRVRPHAIAITIKLKVLSGFRVRAPS